MIIASNPLFIEANICPCNFINQRIIAVKDVQETVFSDINGFTPLTINGITCWCSSLI